MEHTIKILKGADRVRCRPAVIFGDDGIDGVKQSWEDIAGVISAEGCDGGSKHLVISQFADGSLALEDRCRGLYLGEDGALWQDLFCRLVAQSYFEKKEISAKQRTVFEVCTEPEADAAFRLGTVQCASAYMDVRVVRDGIESCLHFEKGENVGGIRQNPIKETDSTYIRWKPDDQVFRQITLPESFLRDKAQMLALHIPGMQVTFCTESAQTAYCYPDGIADYLKPFGQPVYTTEMEAEGQERYNRPRYGAKLRVGLCFVKTDGAIVCCHNQRDMTGYGTHVDKLLEEICQLLQWDLSVTVTKEQLCKQLMLVVLTTTPTDVICWENGTRRSIASTLLRDMAEDSLGSDFRYFLKQNKAHILSLFSDM